MKTNKNQASQLSDPFSDSHDDRLAGASDTATRAWARTPSVPSERKWHSDNAKKSLYLVQLSILENMFGNVTVV